MRDTRLNTYTELIPHRAAVTVGAMADLEMRRFIRILNLLMAV
jgi:hypothetical protein